MSSKIGVVGLGSMGYGMALSLVRAGHETYGFDVSERAVARFVEAGGHGGHDLTEIAHSLDALVIVVRNAEQTRAVLSAALPRLREGAVVVACATVAPSFAREMEGTCGEAGVLYLDAPISGGAAKAAEGELSVMASGAAAAFAAARPALDAVAQTVFELGDAAGTGSAMKAINQLLAGVHIAAMAEALTFGMTQGVDPALTAKVINRCAGASWMFENRAPHVVDGDYTPRSAIDIWPKDLGIVLDIAREAKFGVPLTAAALQQFLAASGSGLGAEDDAAVAKVYARNAGLTLPGVAP